MEKDGMLIKIFLCVSLGSLLWLGSFVLLSECFAAEPVRVQPPAVTPTVAPDRVTVHASGYEVVAVRDEDGTITDFYLRYADFNRDTLVFVRVPTDTLVELTAGAYEVLRVRRPEMPKLFMISELLSLAREDLFCMAAEEAMGSLLGVRPKACTLLTSELYGKLTVQTGQTIRFIRPAELIETFRLVQQEAVTDRPEEETYVYLESYRDIRQVFYRTLPGTAQTSGYRPDPEKILEMNEQFLTGSWEEP